MLSLEPWFWDRVPPSRGSGRVGFGRSVLILVLVGVGTYAAGRWIFPRLQRAYVDLPIRSYPDECEILRDGRVIARSPLRLIATGPGGEREWLLEARSGSLKGLIRVKGGWLAQPLLAHGLLPVTGDILLAQFSFGELHVWWGTDHSLIQSARIPIRLDGRPTKTDGTPLLRTVLLPPGKHEVEFAGFHLRIDHGGSFLIEVGAARRGLTVESAGLRSARFLLPNGTWTDLLRDEDPDLEADRYTLEVETREGRTLRADVEGRVHLRIRALRPDAP